MVLPSSKFSTLPKNYRNRNPHNRTVKVKNLKLSPLPRFHRGYRGITVVGIPYINANLALMYIHKNINLVPEKIIESFALSKNRKINLI